MTQWAPVHTFTIACGPGGAFVDVTALGHVLTDQGGIVRTVGRTDPFSDFPGGSFAFTLDNRDGRYTPDTPNSGATPLSEGMVVAWQTDTRLVSGRIGVSGLQLILPDPGSTSSARIRVTVADVVSVAGRHNFRTPLAAAMILATKPFFYYPLNDPDGSASAAEQSGNSGPPMVVAGGTSSGTAAFGEVGIPAVAETQALLTGVSVDLTAGGNSANPFIQPAYAAGSLGFFGCWITPGPLAGATATLNWVGPIGGLLIAIDGTTGCYEGRLQVGGGGFALSSVVALPGVPVYASLGVTYSLVGSNYTYLSSFYVNGTLAATSSFTTTLAPPTSVYRVDVIGGGSAIAFTSFSHVSHTSTLIHEELAGVTTEALRLQAIDAASPDIVLGTLPGDLSLAPLASNDVTGQSVLDALNDVIRTEQGQLYATTTGSVTAPVETLQVRSRSRPTTVTATWTAATDVQADATISRDLSNTVSEATATTPTTSATYDDVPLFTKVSSASTTISVLSNTSTDAFSAASDRVNRGRKKGFDVPTYSIIGISPLANRSSDLLVLALDDRHRIAGLPVTQLGAPTWDGWLCGWSEYWDAVTATFTLSLETATQTPGVYDTDRYMDSGEFTLSAAITSTFALTFSVATTGAKFTTLVGDLPLTIQVDAEQMTVTAVTSATPQVFTVTRGANGTTAATHSSGATVSLVSPSSVYAY